MTRTIGIYIVTVSFIYQQLALYVQYNRVFGIVKYVIFEFNKYI